MNKIYIREHNEHCYTFILWYLKQINESCYPFLKSIANIIKSIHEQQHSNCDVYPNGKLLNRKTKNV